MRKTTESYIFETEARDAEEAKRVAMESDVEDSLGWETETLGDMYVADCEIAIEPGNSQRADDGKAAHASILRQLEQGDGACLYWQMHDSKTALALVAAGKLRMVGDLVIHPDATEIEAGMAYTMHANCQHHRDDGRGRCIDCGMFLPTADGTYWGADGRVSTRDME